MRRIVLAAAIIFAAVTNLWAQGAGQIPAWNVLGNPSAAGSNARAATLTQMLDGAFCNTTATGQVLQRGASTWACVASPTWIGNHTFNPTSGNAITINPAAASTAQGFNITQSGPSSAATGPLNYNSILVTNPSPVTLPNTLTNGMLNAEARALYVEMNDPSNTGVSVAGGFHMIQNTGTTASGSKIAVIANAYSNKTITGYLLGLDSVVSVDTGGTVSWLVSAQIETAIYGGTALNRIGLEVTNDTSLQASGFDAAIAIDNVGTIAGAFKKGISFGSPSPPTAVPLDPTGDAIYAQQAMTIANFCNCANFTISSNIFNFQNYTVAGNGNVTTTNNINGVAQAIVSNNSVGSSAQAQFNASAGGANTVTMGFGGTNLTNPFYRAQGYLTANGTALVVGTSASNPYIVAINNAEAGRWDNSAPGRLNLGVTGSLVGGLLFNNATSGNITLSPPTGALGGAVLTLPAVTATLLTTSNAGGTISTVTNTLGADVLLNNAANYFDGPSVAQGGTGTWFASGTVTVTDTGVPPTVFCKLWDGTNIIASSVLGAYGAATTNYTMSLSGVSVASPPGNIRISCRDTSATTGKILFNQSGNSKDSTVTAVRIN